MRRGCKLIGKSGIRREIRREGKSKKLKWLKGLICMKVRKKIKSTVRIKKLAVVILMKLLNALKILNSLLFGHQTLNLTKRREFLLQ